MLHFVTMVFQVNSLDLFVVAALYNPFFLHYFDILFVPFKLPNEVQICTLINHSPFWSKAP